MARIRTMGWRFSGAIPRISRFCPVTRARRSRSEAVFGMLSGAWADPLTGS
jgi:ribosomal protein L15E